MNNGDMKIEDLATIVQKGFVEVNTNIAKVDARVGQLEVRVDEGFRDTNARLAKIEDLVEKQMVYRLEFDDLSARVKYLEAKLGVESGK